MSMSKEQIREAIFKDIVDLVFINNQDVDLSNYRKIVSTSGDNTGQIVTGTARTTATSSALDFTFSQDVFVTDQFSCGHINSRINLTTSSVISGGNLLLKAAYIS